MPHAALFVVQESVSSFVVTDEVVSMPHAALFVVQVPMWVRISQRNPRFNAARGFVCGARPPL